LYLQSLTISGQLGSQSHHLAAERYWRNGALHAPPSRYSM
jgi:hypothetical protein